MWADLFAKLLAAPFIAGSGFLLVGWLLIFGYVMAKVLVGMPIKWLSGDFRAGDLLPFFLCLLLFGSHVYPIIEQMIE
ncbi:hypothetical protein [Alcanivorax sediminis]|uniref:Uncharacterized protein n=1 Tax=Alcanivorax sediminis TaxID=2663008 RepID=A0A6N7LU18_9GAMM|nr:hypothetical protein [Alcanivorax sediminis]MQX53917.1 hypothetical protein [Alcanivorax sediminis]